MVLLVYLFYPVDLIILVNLVYWVCLVENEKLTQK